MYFIMFLRTQQLNGISEIEGTDLFLFPLSLMGKKEKNNLREIAHSIQNKCQSETKQASAYLKGEYLIKDHNNAGVNNVAAIYGTKKEDRSIKDS